MFNNVYTLGFCRFYSRNFSKRERLKELQRDALMREHIENRISNLRAELAEYLLISEHELMHRPDHDEFDN
jgi:hypothetical protein